MCDYRTMAVALTWERLGDRVRQARLAAGLAQADVADALRVQRSAVTRIEGGERQVSALELFELADVLGVSPAFLVAESPPAVMSRRAVLTDDSDEVSRLRARLGVALEERARDVAQLLDYGVLSAPPERPVASISDAAEAITSARELRRELDLSDTPLGRMADVCAGAGLFVFIVDGADGGASMLIDGGVGAAVVGARGEPGRRRMTAAHELGHHVLQDAYQSDLAVSAERSERERLIDVFAAEFMLPEEGLRREWARFAGEEGAKLIRIAAEYRVSWTVVVKAATKAELLSRDREKTALTRPPSRGDLLATVGFEPVSDLPVGDTASAWRRAVLRLRQDGAIADGRAVELLAGALTDTDLPELTLSAP